MMDPGDPGERPASEGSAAPQTIVKNNLPQYADLQGPQDTMLEQKIKDKIVRISLSVSMSIKTPFGGK